MKKVFADKSTIAHRFANQLQSEARNPSHNFYFEGDTIYSYGSHFPIAKHIEYEGAKALLFTERGYSRTTSEHIIAVSQATSHLNKIYCYSPNASHDENFNYWLRKCENIASNLTKARKPEKYLSEISYISVKVKKYADFFSLTIPETLQAILNIENKTEYSAYITSKAEYERIEDIRKRKAEKKDFKNSLNKWLHGEGSRMYTKIKYDFLRLVDNRVETTQAVKLPLEYAKKLYNKVKNNQLKVNDKVLDFTVNEVTDRVISIGCHTFNKSYLLKFGANLN